MRAAEFTIVNESVDWFPKIIKAVLAAVPETEEIWFHGSRAIGKERRGSDWDILVVLDPRKVNSFIDVQFALQKLKFKNFDIQAASPTGIITKIARDEGKLLWSNTQHLMAEEEPVGLKLRPLDNGQAKAWIERVYQKYPYTMQNNHVMVWGEGEDQQFAMFELVPSFSKRGAVEVKWFQAYPLRQGVGSRAMQELQAMAREDGISLTLYPWDKGQVSQSKLTKFYRGQGFKPTVKGSKSMAWTPALEENLNVDVPNEEWLQSAIDDAIQNSPDRNGLPYMGKTTATVRNVEIPIRILKRIPGMRREQSNVRHRDLAAIRKIMHTTGKLPLHTHTQEEYKPFINVAYDGSAWVNEGNHRIMAAYELGWPSLPVEISYFDGGERMESGTMYPSKIGLA